jgi:hypothetical protein
MSFNRLAPQRYKRLQLDFVNTQTLWSADNAVLADSASGVEYFLVPNNLVDRRDTTQGLLIDSAMFLEIDNSMNLDLCMLEFAGEYVSSSPSEIADGPWKIDMDVAGKPRRSKRVDDFSPAAEFLPLNPINSEKWHRWHKHSTGHVGIATVDLPPSHGYGYDFGLFHAATIIYPTESFIFPDASSNVGDKWHFVFPIGHGFPAAIGTAGFEKLYILFGLRVTPEIVNNTEYVFSMRLLAHQYERKLVC